MQNSTPGAKILLRSALSDPAFIPDFVRKQTVHLRDKVLKYKHLDRVGTYAGTVLLERI